MNAIMNVWPHDPMPSITVESCGMTPMKPFACLSVKSGSIAFDINCECRVPISEEHRGRGRDLAKALRRAADELEAFYAPAEETTDGVQLPTTADPGELAGVDAAKCKPK